MLIDIVSFLWRESPEMILWTIRAKRNLRHALAEKLCREWDGVGNGEEKRMGASEETEDRLNELLAATFPGRKVVVKDHVLGYRRKPETFILMVEAFGPDADERVGPFVVKIGPERCDRSRVRRLGALPAAGTEE